MADDPHKRCDKCRGARNLHSDSGPREAREFIAFVNGQILDGAIDHNTGKVLIDAANKCISILGREKQWSEMDDLHAMDRRMQEAINKRMELESSARKGQTTVAAGRIALSPDGETKH